ncbi:hypothetical protein ACN38_g2661 [Penicillium nordicum]|uniref:Myb-like DNA-binding domain-containing protein n=1 Tax=Penicillium nordicum TaxID=229535 RepID=A0A0M8P9R1_9EURO|nr:hypothetical protein ACN38_g2661 [Penicillium nordicum]
MTPKNTPQPKKAPTKRRREKASFDKNHEFLLHCLTLSDARINYAAVAECEGITVQQARWRFWSLKTNISSQGNATSGADSQTKKKGRAKKDKQEGNDTKENN